MIVNAAIKQNGEIFTGRRHCFIIQDICNAHPEITYVDGEQGFVDEDGNFLDRKEGYKYAVECGQITKGKFSDVTLYSEDLW